MKQANNPIPKEEPFWAQEILDVLVNGYKEHTSKQAKPTRKEIIKEQLQKKQK